METTFQFITSILLLFLVVLLILINEPIFAIALFGIFAVRVAITFIRLN